MKTEFLKGLGLDEAQIAEVMKQNGQDIEAVKTKFADYDDLKTQLSEAGKAIEGFKAMDIDGIKAAADEWKQKAEQAQKDADARIADMEFSARLDRAISGAKGRSTKAILGELGAERLDALKASKNQEADIGAALETLQKESGYLFDTGDVPPPLPTGTGQTRVLGVTAEQFSRMGYQERLALKQQNPEIYEKVKE